MPFLALIAMYAVQIARRPLDVRLKKRHAGPLTVASLSVVLYLTWDGLRPGGVSSAYFLGEFAGVTSVYLMTWSLVLATRLRWLEQWFGGLDRMYFWHKQYALWAMLLLLPHILVTGRAAQTGITATEAARTEQLGRLLGVISALGLLTLVAVSLARVSRIVALPYERWLLLHRFTGLLVLIALVHGWVLDRVIGASAALKAIYVLIGIAGMAAYGYDELIRRRRAPQADYTVRSVWRRAPSVVDVTLAPTGPAPLPVEGGQFVYLSVGGSSAGREHPFSVAGTGPDGSVRLTVRALGRDTRGLYAGLREGLPATLSGPYGMFDHTLGGARQIWIAGGIGIAPFLGWVNGSDSDALPRVDLFYCTPSAGEAPFLQELGAAARRRPTLRLHPVHSRSDGRLTVSKIQAVAGPLTPQTHVFLCGPVTMVEDLGSGLRRHGIPRDHLHAEHFAFR
jgi:predicted ferric reductase